MDFIKVSASPRTLIEILAVLLILGILSAMAIAKFFSMEDAN